MATAARQVPSTRSPRRHHAAPTSRTASARRLPRPRATAGSTEAVHRAWSGRRRRTGCAPARAAPPGRRRGDRRTSTSPRLRASPRSRRRWWRGTPARLARRPPDRPTRTRRRTKTSGVSFTPAAMPTSRPDQRRSGRSRSTSTAAISSRFTWPKVTFCHTGSRARAPPVSERDQPSGAGRPRARRPARRPGQRRRRERRPQPGGDPSGQRRQRHHQDGGDRRVGERQPGDRVVGAVERPPLEHRPPAEAVDEEVREAAAQRTPHPAAATRTSTFPSDVARNSTNATARTPAARRRARSCRGRTPVLQSVSLSRVVVLLTGVPGVAGALVLQDDEPDRGRLAWSGPEVRSVRFGATGRGATPGNASPGEVKNRVQSRPADAARRARRPRARTGAAR